MKKSTISKIVLIPLITYAGIVVLFESGLGYFQPEAGNTVVITTFDTDGTAHQRVVSLVEIENDYFIAVNHWPRAWYRRLGENPNMQMTLDGETADYVAAIMEGEGHQRASEGYPVPLAFRFLTGFPPRYFIRLDPA